MLTMSTQPIDRLVDDLPTKSVTIYMLQALDFVVPGQWQNITGFDNMVRAVTGESDPSRIKAIARRAGELYQDANLGYQSAMWLYQTVDTADKALAAVALANKISSQISFFSFMKRFTPKANMVQSLDLGLKLTVEVVSFTLMNGLPRDRQAITQFAHSLNSYSKENIMRMATLICVDGLIPLGPNYLAKLTSDLDQVQPEELERNGVYQKIGSMIPGNNTSERLGFIKSTVTEVQDWMSNFQESHNLDQKAIMSKLNSVMNIADDKLSYVAAALDATTNYYEHTGTQSIARHVILRAANEAQGRSSRSGRQQEEKAVEESSRPRRTRRTSSKQQQEEAPRERRRSRGAAGRAPAKPVTSLSGQVEGYLDELGLEYEEEAGDFSLEIGSTRVTITPNEEEEMVQIVANVASNIKKMNKNTALFLLKRNHNVPLGAFELNDDEITFSYTLLRALLDKNALAIAINEVGRMADQLDDRIARMTGGERQADIEGRRAKRRRKISRVTNGQSEDEVWDQLEAYLDELGVDYDEDEDQEALYIPVGSTRLKVEPYENKRVPQILLDLSAPVALEIEDLSKETAIELLEKNTEVPLGGFSFDSAEETIYFSYTLLADSLNADGLEATMKQIAITADKFDEEIADATGGLRHVD